MKSFILSILFLALLQTSFAQKYEYNIIGEHFSDTLTTPAGFETKPFAGVKKAIFEAPSDSTYIYHQVGEGETIEYILNLYQICAPCFSKWNLLNYSDFTSFKNETLYEGEYLKVALKKDYEKGMTDKPKARKYYQDFPNRTYIYDIVNEYGVNINDLREWNNLDSYGYYVENVRLLVGEIEYKYACPCLE